MKPKGTRLTALLLALMLLLSQSASALAYASGIWPEPYEAPGCTSQDAIYRNNGNHQFTCTEFNEPWCETSGKAVYTCIYCGKTQTKSYAALGHDWGDWDQLGAPTCTTGITEVRYCIRCQKQQTRDVAALGHDWSEWYVQREPTCTETGYQVRYCRRCQLQQDQVIPALGHAWGAWRQEYPGDCMNRAMNVRKCTRCGIEEYRYGDYGDHVWGEWHVVKEPTATLWGLEECVCKINSDHVQQHEIPPTGDPYGTPELVNLVVEKIWDDEDDKDGLRPDHVTVTLLADGEPVEDVILSEENEWKYETDDIMPRIDPTGKEIVYTWEEKDVLEGYVAEIFPDDSYTAIVNTRVDDGDEGEAALKVELTDVSDPLKSVYDLNDIVAYEAIITNIGDVDLELYDWLLGDHRGIVATGHHEGRTLLKPGESTTVIDGYSTKAQFNLLSEFIAPGTETEDLAGILWREETYPGYRPGTDEALCEGVGRIEYKIAKPEDGGDELPHGMTVTVSWDEGIGEGKRYKGALIPLYFTCVNSGETPIRTWLDYDSDTELQPGESTSFTLDWYVEYPEVEEGVVHVSEYNTWAWNYDYQNAEGSWIEDYSESNPVIIPLTYPEPPEPDNPELTLTFLQDNPEKELYDPEEEVWAEYHLINSGNVPLKVVAYFKSEGVTEYDHFDGFYDPGDDDFSSWGWWRIEDGVTPGTETEELLGTVTISFYYVGLDVDTDEELCRTQTITRTWKVRKPIWEVPSLSALEAVVDIFPGYESADPSGYQLGEYYHTRLTVTNTGDAMIPAMTVSVYDPYDGWTGTWFDDDFEVGCTYVTTFGWNSGDVSEADVERGFIYFPPVKFTWNDPDSGKAMTAFSNPLILPVISKTGLILQKGYEAPANGSYFTEGEEIKWTLTLTNTSDEPILNVVVTDQGDVIGQFDRIEPGEKIENFTIPSHTVTDYDAEVLGWVFNQAEATGTDLQKEVHFYQSNLVQAPVSAPIPPIKVPVIDPNKVDLIKTIVSTPKNGSYYQLDETIKYNIVLINKSGSALEDIVLYDSLSGFAPIDYLGSLADGDSHTFYYNYTVTQPDVDAGKVVNKAHAVYTGGEPVYSNKETAYTGKLNNPDKIITPPVVNDGKESCQLILTAIGDNGANYTLHACAEHTAAAQNAEAAGLEGDFGKACDIWTAEIEALYKDLYERGSSEVKAAVVRDLSSFAAYATAFRALRGDEAAAEMLRLACAELCCMSRTAPERLPSSLLNSASHLMTPAGEACGREIGALKGSDADVTERYDADHAEVFQEVTKQARSAQYGKAQANAFNQALRRWQMALDALVNAEYKAADKEGRKLIAAYRKSLDSLYTGRKELMEALYADAPEITAEALSNLYRNALIDACGR